VAEHLKIVNLNCANCGGVLEIQSDMDRFACGYCGSAQIVERRGGTVALRLVVDAVARVQVGTDRTAAELALVRLEKEIATVNAQWQTASNLFDNWNSPGSQLAGLGALVAIVVVFLFGLVFMGALAAGSVEVSIVSIVLLGGGLAAFIFCLKQYSQARKRYAAKRAELWAPYAQRIQELEQLIKKNREMVNNS
jgi:ribosomal protein S27AE